MSEGTAMKRCVRCGSDRIQGVELAEVVPVGELEFEGLVRGFRCEACGEEYLDGVDTGHLEGCIAAWLAEHGEISREAFRFMRKAIGMRAAELAELLDVTPETVSHWETGKYSIPWSAVAILGAIVSEHHAGGPTTTLDRLRRLKERPTVAKAGLIRLRCAHA